MIPIGDDNRFRRTVPVVTYALIVLNFIFFFVELNSSDAFIMRWAFVPARFLADPAGDFLTIFTAMFMHAGWIHILGNMLYLWIFGDNVEDRFGHFTFLVFYIFCGLAATVAQMAVDPGSNVPNLGASGAIAGVLGAYIILFPLARVRVLVGWLGIIPLPALVVIGFWIVLQFFNSIGSFANTQTDGVAYMAHVGGFLTGLVLTFLFRGNSSPQLGG